MNCPRGLTQSEIFMEFGKDDESLDKCTNCPNIKYQNGIMECTEMTKEDNER